jgi:hypothetical protein
MCSFVNETLYHISQSFMMKVGTKQENNVRYKNVVIFFAMDIDLGLISSFLNIHVCFNTGQGFQGKRIGGILHTSTATEQQNLLIS